MASAMASNHASNGFRLNHVGLRVADIERSIAFYTQIFGMKVLARMPLDTVTIAFVGYVTPEVAEVPVWAREGVLELVAPKDSGTALQKPHNADSRFVKLAISVPDMASAMKYITSHNVRILKDAGTAESSEVVVPFLGCESPEKGYDQAFWKSVERVPFLEDPDGHLIEIIPY